MAQGYKTGGRQAGTPNKATSNAHESIGLLLDAKMENLERWIDITANGVKELRVADDGSQYEEYVVKPNPAKAFELVYALLEFSVPKLTRMQFADQKSEFSIVQDRRIQVRGATKMNSVMGG